jgi:hypothetical protein
VLDPACGCGNFLYVAYRELRSLEHELKERLVTIARQTGMPPPDPGAVLPVEQSPRLRHRADCGADRAGHVVDGTAPDDGSLRRRGARPTAGRSVRHPGRRRSRDALACYRLHHREPAFPRGFSRTSSGCRLRSRSVSRTIASTGSARRRTISTTASVLDSSAPTQSHRTWDGPRASTTSSAPAA